LLHQLVLFIYFKAITMSTVVNIHAKVSLADSVLMQDMNGESALLNLNTEYYFSQNRVATQMLNALTESDSIAIAHERLLDHYEVQPEALQQDLLNYVEQLLKAKLVTVHLSILPTHKITLSPHVLMQDMAGESALLNIQTGQYFSQNPIATTMLAVLTQSQSFSSACETLLSRYEVEPEALKRDVLNYAQQLLEAGLIELQAPPRPLAVLSP
jgi:hypothetical protein